MYEPFTKAMNNTLSTTDPRTKLISSKLKKEAYKADALIEVLHTAQNIYGYLPIPVLAYISKSLHLPPSRVYATVSFYHFFSLKPKGEHTCLVCTGTACYVKGAQQILEKIEQVFHLKPGETSKDNKLGIQVARCVGACGLAPVVVLDDEVQGNIVAEEFTQTMKEKMGLL